MLFISRKCSLAHSLFVSSSMPISSERAERACEAVIVDDIECAELLSRLPDHVLDSPFLREDRKDEYIVAFLRGKVAGEVHIWMASMHAWLSFLLFLQPNLWTTGGGIGGNGVQGADHLLTSSCSHASI